MDRRLQLRYQVLVKSQMNAASRTAAGPSLLPQGTHAAAVTQAAWRFYNNPRVSLAALIQPLREIGLKEAAQSSSEFVLLAHDWSKLDYGTHSSKQDRCQLTHRSDIGYDLTTALLIDAHDGAPLVPMEMHLKTAHAVHSTSTSPPVVTDHHLDQLQPIMDSSREWNLPRRVVHVIDREADSLGHYRDWQAAEHLFLVRSNDRRVRWNDQSWKISEIVGHCESSGYFQGDRPVEYHGKPAIQQVAEVNIVLDRRHKTQINGKQYAIAGPPVPLRLVMSRILDETGQVLSTWTLLTNVPADKADAGQVALWYYWRWRIESFYKLLKSHGQEAEYWQQESGEAVARRLLVATMACVVVWRLQRETTPQAAETRRILIRLSGRQMKHKVESTAPALLAGYFVLLSMLQLLEQTDHTLDQLKSLADNALPFINPSGNV